MSKVMSVLILLAAVFCVAALAQVPTGTISGIVTDESGAVIPNASVVIHDKGTGADRTLSTGPDGAFSAPSLPARVYEVRVASNCFRATVREATVEVGATTTADIHMIVGQTNEVVTVE